MGIMPGASSPSQQGLSAVNPRMPQTRDAVFQTATGGRLGQPSGCERMVQISIERPLVLAMKLVPVRWLSDSGRKWSKTGAVPGRELGGIRKTAGALVRNTACAQRTQGAKKNAETI